MSALDKIRSRPRLWASAALVTDCVTSGTILGTTLTANAATSGTSTTSPSSSSSPSSNSSSGPATTPAMGGCHGGPRALPDSGTVSAVGTDSVTIDGKTYAVTSSSDIDKNGEASLADLKAGDKVTFSTVSGAATPTIDKLHAGNESLDMPPGPPMGGPHGGTLPQQQSSGSTSSTA